MATTTSTLHRDEVIERQRTSAPPTKLHVCAECRYALLFAVQPRALCTCQDAAAAGKILFAGQPACADMSLPGDEELVLSAFASGLNESRARFV